MGGGGGGGVCKKKIPSSPPDQTKCPQVLPILPLVPCFWAVMESGGPRLCNVYCIGARSGALSCLL